MSLKSQVVLELCNNQSCTCTLKQTGKKDIWDGTATNKYRAGKRQELITGWLQADTCTVLQVNYARYR